MSIRNSAFLFCFGLLGCTAKEEETALPPTANNRNLLLIVLDGIRTAELTRGEGQVSDLTGTTGEEWGEVLWNSFGKDATVVRETLHAGVTITTPSHVSLFTGRPSSIALMETDTDIATLYRADLPGIFQLGMDQGRFTPTEVSFVSNGPLLRDTSGTIYPSNFRKDSWFEVLKNGDKPSTDDREVFDALEQEIKSHPRLLVANVHNVDRMGHYAGSADAYEEGVQTIASRFKEFWATLQNSEKEWLDNTLVVVTTDHGRHSDDYGEEEAWRQHGDSCFDCRAIPLFLSGPGVEGGRVAEGAWLQTDTSSLMAAWFELEAPFMEGVAMNDLISGLDFRDPAGSTSLSLSGGLVAARHLLPSAARRSEIRVDGGEVLSSAEAVLAQEPVIASDDGLTVICWREWGALSPEGRLPWTAACRSRVDGGAWEVLEFPAEEVGPSFRPELHVEGGKLWATWVENPNQIATAGQDWTGIKLVTWTPGEGWSSGWSSSQSGGEYWTGLSAAVSGNSHAVAVGGGPDRISRAIEVFPPGGRAWSTLDASPALGGGSARTERPALHLDGTTLRVAAIGSTESANILVYWESTDSGRTWSTASSISGTGEVLPHLAARWEGDDLYWAALEGTEAQLCRKAAASVSCRALDSAWVDSFDVEGSRAVASVWDAKSGWVVRTVDF